MIPIPIAHGEGRFTSRIPDLLDRLREGNQIVFQYVDADGNLDESREVNPNGAMAGIAGLCNPEGNVLGLMPHPERASFLRQIPAEVGGEWGCRKQAAWGDQEALAGPGPGRVMFESLARALGVGAPA